VGKSNQSVRIGVMSALAPRSDEVAAARGVLDAAPAAESDLPTALRKVVRDGEAGDGNLLEALAHTLEMPVEAVDLRVSRFDGTVGVIFEVPDESIGTAVTEVIEKRRDRRR
jgi:hypothetical protein